MQHRTDFFKFQEKLGFLFCFIRNKTRGHGADSPELYSNICDDLYTSIKLVSDNYFLLKEYNGHTL